MFFSRLWLAAFILFFSSCTLMHASHLHEEEKLTEQLKKPPCKTTPKIPPVSSKNLKVPLSTLEQEVLKPIETYLEKKWGSL